MWAVDEPKLKRVRALMAERDLDALVVRAPDNVLYLTGYWGMKGYDAVVFPREGDPTLVVIEPQLEEAQQTAWTSDVRPFPGYDERDPRPPHFLGLDVVQDVVRERGFERIGLELSMGTQSADRMVGEPTTPWLGWFEGFGPDPVDATLLLLEARSIKTEQEVERMRLAGELARLGMEHVRERIRPGMKVAEVGAMFEGHVHSIGVGYQGRVRLARAFTLVWCGPTIRTFTCTADCEVLADEPTLLEIWVCADGYWVDLTKNLCPGRMKPEYEKLAEQLLAIRDEAVDFARPGASLAELDRLMRSRLAEAGYPGQPSHPICHGVGARAHEPPYAHQAGGGEVRERMVLAIEPGAYWEGGGGLRVEDCHLIGADSSEMLCGYPDVEVAWTEA